MGVVEAHGTIIFCTLFGFGRVNKLTLADRSLTLQLLTVPKETIRVGTVLLHAKLCHRVTDGLTKLSTVSTYTESEFSSVMFFILNMSFL